MAHRRGLSRQVLRSSPSSPRRTSWSLGPGGTTATAISASSAVLVGSGSTPTVPLTVVRLRGELMITMVGTAGILEGFRGAFGIGIASLPAFTAGVNSVPTPITEEADENWLYHTYFTIMSQLATINGSVAEIFKMTVDSKAMRKADVDKVFYAAIEVVEVGTAVMDVSFNSRFLNLLT